MMIYLSQLECFWHTIPMYINTFYWVFLCRLYSISLVDERWGSHLIHLTKQRVILFDHCLNAIKVFFNYLANCNQNEKNIPILNLMPRLSMYEMNKINYIKWYGKNRRICFRLIGLFATLLLSHSIQIWEV
jgi:hypothetical protein